jgi:ribose transport system substrate-binding protein
MFSTSPNGRRCRRGGIAAVLALLLLSAVACSSSSSSITSQPGAATNGATAAAAAGSCAATASAKLAKEAQPLNQPLPTDRVPAAKFKGKTVWFLEYNAASPTVAGIAAGFREAGSAIGVNARFYNGRGTPSGYNDGLNQAVAQGAAAILMDGVDPSLVSDALKNAASKHIPVVDIFGSSPTAPYPTGLVSHLTFDPVAMGAAQADFALAKSGCKGGVLYSAVQGLDVENALVTGAKAEVAALCGSCGFYSTETDPTALATKVSGQVEAELQQHPDIAYVLVGADSMVQYAGNAITTLSDTKVRVVGVSGTNIPNMIKGQLPAQAADVRYMSTETAGWFGMYEALQAANGQRNEVRAAFATVDAANLNVPAEVPNYKETFLNLFGVTS